jgi:hypothetical protein
MAIINNNQNLYRLVVNEHYPVNEPGIMCSMGRSDGRCNHPRNYHYPEMNTLVKEKN